MGANPDRLTRVAATRAMVMEKCKYYQQVQVWPLNSDLDSEGWLRNFTADEEQIACQLLNSFLFFPEPMVNALLVSAFRRLSARLAIGASDHAAALRVWSGFLAQAVVTWVPGERPSPTDSGLLFARKTRQWIGIPERNIVAPGLALEIAVRENRPVVMVDDFVGTGEQCVKAWQRSRPEAQGRSFEAEAQTGSLECYYCPLLSTRRGKERIESSCTSLFFSPVHILPDNYSLLADDSVFWPASLVREAVDVVKQASARAGLPDTGGSSVIDWQGYRKLGLGIAFAHGVPDATLPIFYHRGNGWHPLVRRS